MSLEYGDGLPVYTEMEFPSKASYEEICDAFGGIFDVYRGLDGAEVEVEKLPPKLRVLVYCIQNHLTPSEKLIKYAISPMLYPGIRFDLNSIFIAVMDNRLAYLKWICKWFITNDKMAEVLHNILPLIYVYDRREIMQYLKTTYSLIFRTRIAMNTTEDPPEHHYHSFWHSQPNMQEIVAEDIFELILQNCRTCIIEYNNIKSFRFNLQVTDIFSKLNVIEHLLDNLPDGINRLRNLYTTHHLLRDQIYFTVFNPDTIYKLVSRRLVQQKYSNLDILFRQMINHQHHEKLIQEFIIAPFNQDDPHYMTLMNSLEYYLKQHTPFIQISNEDLHAYMVNNQMTYNSSTYILLS